MFPKGFAAKLNQEKKEHEISNTDKYDKLMRAFSFKVIRFYKKFIFELIQTHSLINLAEN